MSKIIIIKMIIFVNVFLDFHFIINISKIILIIITIKIAFLNVNIINFDNSQDSGY